MGCYICGAREFTTCHHCGKPICKEHAHFVEEIGYYLCDSCYLAHKNGSPNILSE